MDKGQKVKEQLIVVKGTSNEELEYQLYNDWFGESRSFRNPNQNNFPLENSEDQADNEDSSLKKCESSQTNSILNQFPSDQSKNSEKDNGGKKEIKERNDAHQFAQNVGSKSKSFLLKLLTQKKTKEYKTRLKKEYQNYLKDSKASNSQVILVFCYLFLVKNNAVKPIYSQYQDQFVAHLQLKLKDAQFKEEKERQALFVKITTNIALTNYLFNLKGQEQINFKQIRSICQPLYQGRQTIRINAPLQAAIKIQAQILLDKQNEKQDISSILTSNLPSMSLQSSRK